MLSQHFVQSFVPGEITPEKALEIGKQLCDRFLKGEYQYFLAVHTDKKHIHLHCIFNNVNQYDGRTFETHENQGKKSERAWKKLLNCSDKLCHENGLSVIEDYESTKGKSYYEWDMDRQGISWKSKLKFAIDQVVKNSNDFDDFLRKCKDFGVIAEYNPQCKIDLKFQLVAQKEKNPCAKMTRAKTLGWFYETKQIIFRICNYRGLASYKPRTKIIKTTTEKIFSSKGLTGYVDRKNMKEVSRALNLLSKEGLTRTDVEKEAQFAFMRKGVLSEELNSLKTQISEIDLQIKTVKTYLKYKPIYDEMKSLAGQNKNKFKTDYSDELEQFHKAYAQLYEWYPDKSAPSLEFLTEKKKALQAELSEKNAEYRSAKADSEQLVKAMQTIDDYLENERDVEQKRKYDNLE